MGQEPGARSQQPEAGGTACLFPLSYMQESLWFFEQVAPGIPAYNLPEAWRLRGWLDPALLEGSIAEMIERHEALRTAFGANDGKPVQMILPAAPFHLQRVDLSHLAEPEAEARRRIAAEVRRPFDLRHAPLLRAAVYRLGPEDWVLFVMMHHIISDAWSFVVFQRELAELYRARLAGEPARLKDLSIQYADFAAWQRELAEGVALAESLAYWKQKLQGELPLLALPADHTRPVVQSHRGATLFFALPELLCGGLKELSARQGVTLFMVLLAAFKALLLRYTGQQDIAVGSPLAGRERLETEELIGFFSNTHVLRTDLSGDPTFVELLRRVRETTLGACAHQEVPFEKLVTVLQPERSLSYHPLFQAVIGLVAGPLEDWPLPGLAAEPLEVDNSTAKFDWTLLFTETRHGLRLRFEYSTDLFEAGTVARFVRQFQRLLAEAIAAPERPLSEIPLLEDEERHQVLFEWNQTATKYEREACIHELFAARANERPEALALKLHDQRLTYGELNQRAERLALRLRQLGVGPDIVVGLYLERSFELITAMLAILKAGGAYLPLDSGYPAERLAFMLQDAGARLLLTQPKLAGALLKDLPLAIHSFTPEAIGGNATSDPSGEQVLLLGIGPTPGTGLCPADAPQPQCLPGADNLAYVVYTSGSTGVPKGVGITHRGVVRLVRNTNYIDFSPADTFLQLAPISFDASTLEIWGPLLNGASLVLFPPGLPSLEELGRFIERERVTVLWLTSGLFNQMVDEQLERLKGLRCLLAGGEALSVPHVTKAIRELTGCQLINGYGPTENTTFSCCYRVPASWEGGRSVPIGRPVSNTQVYVLGSRLEPVPIGMPGELYVSGDGLARGYLNCVELTERGFVPHPFAGAPGERLYRTGDLARWLPGGNLEFLGRCDEQVKVRGYRVEPAEVEAVLAQHPAVAAAAVSARRDRSSTKQLVAYVVPRTGTEITAAQLREYLAAKLPPFMIPAHFVTLAEMPLTASGKVNRRALPAPEVLQDPRDQPYEPPRTPVETILARIWEEILGCKRVGIHDNFFHLGGHSLLATQIVSRISRVLGLDVPVRSIFEGPTVAMLAEAVTRAQQAGSLKPLVISPQAARPRAAALLARLDELSDSEVEQLLQDPELNPAFS